MELANVFKLGMTDSELADESEGSENGSIKRKRSM